MKSNSLIGHSLLKNRRNYKRKSKYETGYSADNMVYKNFIKDIYEEDNEPMPKYLYHATFTSAVPQIKNEGLKQFQTSNWVKGPKGERYNKNIAGIFAFDNPIDALNWGGKMEWEFRDINKDISIIRIQIPEDDFWEDDPAEDPFVATTGKSKYSGQDISAESIIDSVRLDDLGRPGQLDMSRDDWLKQTAEKLRESLDDKIFYHGSYDKFKVGQVLTPREDQYEESWGPNNWYQALEEHRPTEYRRHSQSVFMVVNEDDVDVAGGATDYVYKVKPIENVERHDLNWSSEISYLLDQGHDANSVEVKEAASNYWTGVPHHNESVWEYTAPKAEIVGVLEEGDMKADREAGIKYVDDPDWERLHDMDDKIIQAYIDHKEPKKELTEGVNDPHIFKAVFMAGCPGAGKSYVSKALFGGSGLRVVNTDQALEYLMAKHGLDPTMPDEEKEERDIQRRHAKQLTSTRQQNYVDGRLGLIIDGTGKDDGKIQNAKKELENIGYETRMVFVDTDLETAHERNMKRPERSVKPELLTDTFKTCRRVGGKLRRIFNFSKEDFQVINNSKNSETEDELKETYDSMQRWLATPVTNREALDWMDQQTGFSEGLATITEDACGDCFSKAGRAMINMTETQELYGMQMVHAYVYGQGKLKGRRFPHAWTEQGDMVLDNSNGNNIEMHKALYYKLGGVDEKPGAYATYNKEDTMKKLLSTQKYGPWDLDDTLDEGKQPKHNSSIANTITEKFASLAQQRAAYASGYKGKKKSKSNSA
jgi:shikimate kinase